MLSDSNCLLKGFLDISNIDKIPTSEAQNILVEILEMGCKSQNVKNIQLGRDAINKLPEDWLLNQLPGIVEQHMFLEKEWQEWEFRRLAEMLQYNFPCAFVWLIDYAKQLRNHEIDGIIADLRTCVQ